MADTPADLRLLLSALTAQLEAERATGDETARHISRLLDHLARETARADKAVAEAKALREELEEQKRLPEDVIERLIALGPVEWGASAAQSDEAHCAGLAETLALTRQDFGFEGDRQMHGVFLKGTGIVVCHTGTSPNSAKHAAIIDGALNMLHRLALEHRATLAQPADGGAT